MDSDSPLHDDGRQGMAEKVRKLLALADSPDEAEAQAALLKARELMTRYELSHADIDNAPPPAVVDESTGLDFSARRDPWLNSLAAVIGENFCVVEYLVTPYGKRTHEIRYFGKKEDVTAAIEALRGAAAFIHKQNARIARSMKQTFGRRIPAAYIRQETEGYGEGFSAGLERAFAAQSEEMKQKWGLVPVVSAEVREQFEDQYQLEEFTLKRGAISGTARSQGYEDGFAYGSKKQIGD